MNRLYDTLATMPAQAIWELVSAVGVYTLILFIWHKNRIKEISKEYQNRVSTLEDNIENLQQNINTLQDNLKHQQIDNASLKTKLDRVPELLEEKRELERLLEQCRAKSSKLERSIGTLSAQLSEERRVCSQRLEELKSYHSTIKDEFKQIATSILLENSKEYTQISQEKIQSIIEPFKAEVKSFREKVENIHIEETKEISSLKTQLNYIIELNDRLSKEASRLSKALEQDSKTQGVWGEMVLKRVLEISGLREGKEYEQEVTLYNSSNQRYRPDVIVHLPDGKDIIIDAKTSLRDYIAYVNSTDENERREFAIRHTKAIKEHIKRLSQKDYTKLEGINNLDLVLMFIPIDGALALAQEVDSELYEKAYQNNIVLVTPSSLLTALKAIEQSWRVVYQNKNALEIAKQAGKLYDKFVLLLEDINKIDKQLNTLKSSFENTIKKIGEGRDNLISQCQKLKELGARATKEIPKDNQI